jgi:uncharacterized protein (DUF1330 family)
MSAYFLFDNLEVRDPAKLDAYKRRVAPVVQQCGGRYVVLGGNPERLEGEWRPRFPVMIEFPSAEQAHRWYDSPDYAALKALRLSAGRFSAVIIEGV